MRAQLLDGSAQRFQGSSARGSRGSSARTILDTIHHIGFLQIDPIATVATPQHLVLWSRLGAYDTAELERLLWKERKLFEWNAYIWPIETLPRLQARMRSPQRHIQSRAWLKEHASFRRYVLREVAERGPLLSLRAASRAAGSATARSL